MPRVTKRSKAKKSSANRPSPKSPSRAVPAGKTRRGKTAAATRAPSRRTAAKKATGKTAARSKVEPAALRLSGAAGKQEQRPPMKVAKAAKKTGAARKPVTVRRQESPRKKEPLSAEARKNLAGEHLRALLEEKKRRAAQTPPWQTIVHHDHAPRPPDALPYGAPPPAATDRAPDDSDEDN
jgi:hypothetical protein